MGKIDESQGVAAPINLIYTCSIVTQITFSQITVFSDNSYYWFEHTVRAISETKKEKIKSIPCKIGDSKVQALKVGVCTVGYSPLVLLFTISIHLSVIVSNVFPITNSYIQLVFPTFQFSLTPGSPCRPASSLQHFVLLLHADFSS